MLDRRAFLIGTGLLTTAFIKKARAFSRGEGRPLLMPTGATQQVLHVSDWIGDEDWRWRVSLGPDEGLPPPPAPTWREYLQEKGEDLQSEAGLRRVLKERCLRPDELDAQLDGMGWESEWEHWRSPQAKAYLLLRHLDLGRTLGGGAGEEGHVQFTGVGGNPLSCERWVDLKDDLSVSLLQARLIELNLPIRIQVET